MIQHLALRNVLVVGLQTRACSKAGKRKILRKEPAESSLGNSEAPVVKTAHGYLPGDCSTHLGSPGPPICFLIFSLMLFSMPRTSPSADPANCEPLDSSCHIFFPSTKDSTKILPLSPPFLEAVSKLGASPEF